MKKLNILTVSLVAIMAVGAARAEIASTSYVTDISGDKTALTTTEKGTLVGAINEVNKTLGDQKTELTEAIAGAISTAAEDATTKANAAKTAAEKTAADALDAAKSELEGKITASEYDDTAVKASIAENAGKITALETDNTANKSAISALESDNTTNKSNISALQSGKQDKLTSTNLVGAGSVSVAIADDGKITVTGTEYDDTALAGRVSTNETAIATLQTEQETQNTNIAAAQTAAESAATAAATAQTAADAADTKAAAAKSAADAAQNTADAAIPKPGTDCASNDCALLFKNGTYVWEPVGR